MSKKWYAVFSISLLLSVVLSMIGCSGGGTTTTTTTGGIKAKTGDTIKVTYTGMFQDGEIFDTNDVEGGVPFEFTLGENKVIVGFENAVIGMAVGETKTVTILPKDAYGEYNTTKTTTIQRSQLSDSNVKVGDELLLSEYYSIFTITAVSETTVTGYLNHYLAGETLIFKIKLLEIKAK